MRAVVKVGAGKAGMLKVVEIEKPYPKGDEVLVQVVASTVTRGDVILKNLHPLMTLPMRLFGVKQKKIPGHEFAGIVQAVGRSVSRFKEGDRVFGTTTGLSVGANAEFISLPEEWDQGIIEIMPECVGFNEAAAAAIGGMTALYLLQQGDVKSGQEVLIYGASGSVGTYAVQLADAYGAEVTGVCSTQNLELVRSIGADHIIDYTKQDLLGIVGEYDVIFDAVGKTSKAAWKNVLKNTGQFLTVRTPTKEVKENLAVLKKLLEEGKIHAVIDQIYPLERIADAYEYVQTGHKKGNVVIQISSSEGEIA